jgi:glutaredoxin-related protein
MDQLNIFGNNCPICNKEKEDLHKSELKYMCVDCNDGLNRLLKKIGKGKK